MNNTPPYSLTCNRVEKFRTLPEFDGRRTFEQTLGNRTRPLKDTLAMALTGLIVILTGLLLLGSTAALVMGLHRSLGVPYALLSVGAITAIGSLIAQIAALQIIDRALLGILPVGAFVLGITAGFSEEWARFLGFQYLAPAATTRAQALMIGAGHGLVETVYTALIAISLGLSVLASNPASDQTALDDVSRASAQALNSLLPVILHMALSWLVLQTFLRSELYWVFIAIFAHAVAEIMAALLGPNDAWIVVGWRSIVALAALLLIRRLHGPPAPRTIDGGG